MNERDKRRELEVMSRPDGVGQPQGCERSGMDRATFLKRFVASGALVGGLALVAGCSSGERDASEGSGESADGAGSEMSDSETADDFDTARPDSETTDCGDLSGLSEEEREKREIYGYVEETSFPDSRCENCSLYLPPDQEGSCGGCILFSGPVFAEAYCDYWAPVNENS